MSKKNLRNEEEEVGGYNAKVVAGGFEKIKRKKRKLRDREIPKGKRMSEVN